MADTYSLILESAIKAGDSVSWLQQDPIDSEIAMQALEVSELKIVPAVTGVQLPLPIFGNRGEKQRHA